MGSQRPAPELGISTVQLPRPVAAGAFLLGPPEGGASEPKARPARPLGQVCYRRAGIARSLWLGWTDQDLQMF